MTSQRPLNACVSARDAWRVSTLALGILFAAQAFVWACSAAADSLVASDVYAAPQRLVAVDGARRLNLYCVGSGSPTVILDAGSGNSMATWRHVQAEIGQTTRVCAYDRAGLGFSDAAERPSDLRNIVDDLRRLVKAAPIAAPFVYVGHSLAGAIGLLYVATYPEDIAGAVMVEPAFAGEVAALEAPLPPDKRNVIVDAVPAKPRLRRRLSCPRSPGRARFARDRRGARLRRCQRQSRRARRRPSSRRPSIYRRFRACGRRKGRSSPASRPRGTSQTSIRGSLTRSIHPSAISR